MAKLSDTEIFDAINSPNPPAWLLGYLLHQFGGSIAVDGADFLEWESKFKNGELVINSYKQIDPWCFVVEVKQGSSTAITECDEFCFVDLRFPTFGSPTTQVKLLCDLSKGHPGHHRVAYEGETYEF